VATTTSHARTRTRRSAHPESKAFGGALGIDRGGLESGFVGTDSGDERVDHGEGLGLDVEAAIERKSRLAGKNPPLDHDESGSNRSLSISMSRQIDIFDLDVSIDRHRCHERDRFHDVRAG
jgi:hypothetical protein